MTEGINSEHKQESRQSSKNARPVRRRGQPTSRRHARNCTGQHGRSGGAPYHQPTLAERVGATHQTNTMPQEMRQARKGQILVTREEQNLDPHREADREGETSHTREHGPYQPPRRGSQRGKAWQEQQRRWAHPLSAGDRGAVVGAEVQGHPARTQPHEGSSKGPSSSLYERPGATNRILIHSRGAALPSSSKV